MAGVSEIAQYLDKIFHMPDIQTSAGMGERAGSDLYYDFHILPFQSFARVSIT